MVGCNYTFFLNEQKRFDALLNFCNNNNEKVIIYTRFKYATLLFSKLFNFEINFSFIYSKYYKQYWENDLRKFINGEVNILLTDKINMEYTTIPNLKKIIFYDIEYDCIKYFNYNYNNVEFILYLLNDNNNSLLYKLIQNKDIKPNNLIEPTNVSIHAEI